MHQAAFCFLVQRDNTYVDKMHAYFVRQEILRDLIDIIKCIYFNYIILDVLFKLSGGMFCLFYYVVATFLDMIQSLIPVNVLYFASVKRNRTIFYLIDTYIKVELIAT